MADKTIADLTAAGSLSLTDLFEIENSGNNSRKATIQMLVDLGMPVLIGSHVFTGSETEHTFSTIPSGFTDLVLVGRGRSARASNVTSDIYVQFNGDTGTNYNYQRGSASNATAGAQASTSVARALEIAFPAATAPSDSKGGFTAEILGYADPFHTMTKWLGGRRDATGAAGMTSHWGCSWWLSTVAVSSIRIFDANTQNFVSGSKVSLYGRM